MKNAIIKGVGATYQSPITVTNKKNGGRRAESSGKSSGGVSDVVIAI